MELVYVAWLSLLALVVADVLARRKLAPVDAPAAERGPSRQALAELAALGLLVFAVRALLATAREQRNVDEVQYAATAAWIRDTGRSLFDWAWNLHGHQLLFAFGSADDPFTAVDVLTSLAVGATAFLLGWTVLRRRPQQRWAAPLVTALYGLALLRFEGLTSNKEPWVNLFISGYLLLRIGFAGAPRPLLRRLLAGVCLGAAFVCKEQAGIFVLIEPLVEVAERTRAGDARGPGAKTFLRHQVLAAAGFFVPVGLLFAGFASRGKLGAYLSFLADWAGRGGLGTPRLVRDVEVLPGIPTDLAVPEPSALTVILDGWLPLLLSAAGVLAVTYVLRALFQPKRSWRRLDLLELALVGQFLFGLFAVSIGLRWYGHYWMLLVPGLVVLGVIRLLEALEEVRRPALRLTSGVLLALVAYTAAQEAYFLSRPVGRVTARGGGLNAEQRLLVAGVADYVRKNTPPEGTIFVWGWQPELYFAANRTPASRYVGGVTAGRAEVFEDLKDPRLSMVLKSPAPDWHEDELSALRDPWDLSHHPDLAALLQSRGFVLRAGPDELDGWTAWGPAPR